MRETISLLKGFVNRLSHDRPIDINHNLFRPSTADLRQAIVLITE